jgi:hypothetical protein
MQAFSVEKTIIEGENQVQDLFKFVVKMSDKLEAYEMEKAIFARLMKIGLSAVKAYFGSLGTGDVGPELISEEGMVMEKQAGLYGRDYFSVFGKVKVPRTCYRGQTPEGVMPLDAKANLPSRCYSYLLQEWMNIFDIRDGFKESQISLNKLLGLEISQSRFEIVNRESAVNYDKFYDQKLLPNSKTEGEFQILGFDGKGVPVIKKEAAKIKARLGKGEKKQKKKEAMVGVSYTVDRNIRTPEEVAKNLVYPDDSTQVNFEKEEEAPPVRAQNIRRMASLERSKEDVVHEIVKDAERRDPEKQRPWVVVMDGALHLWTLIASVLNGIDYTGVLDIIHVVEYLWDAANALDKGEKTDRHKWVYDRLLSILNGNVGRVIGGLKQIITKNKKRLTNAQIQELERVITYFKNHKKWMKYNEYLEAGYPIGSGVVESACGHTVKNRMEGTGRRWSIKGAESMLLLRSIYTSLDWDNYWRSHMIIQREEKYDTVLKSGHDTLDDYKAELLFI